MVFHLNDGILKKHKTVENHTRNEWKRSKKNKTGKNRLSESEITDLIEDQVQATLQTSGKDVKIHSKRVEKM